LKDGLLDTSVSWAGYYNTNANAAALHLCCGCRGRGGTRRLLRPSACVRGPARPSTVEVLHALGTPTNSAATCRRGWGFGRDPPVIPVGDDVGHGGVCFRGLFPYAIVAGDDHRSGLTPRRRHCGPLRVCCASLPLPAFDRVAHLFCHPPLPPAPPCPSIASPLPLPHSRARPPSLPRVHSSQPPPCVLVDTLLHSPLPPYRHDYHAATTPPPSRCHPRRRPRRRLVAHRTAHAVAEGVYRPLLDARQGQPRGGH